MWNRREVLHWTGAATLAGLGTGMGTFPLRAQPEKRLRMAVLTTGLAAGWSVEEAISLGCRCGAACLDGAGPYGAQLTLGR